MLEYHGTRMMFNTKYQLLFSTDKNATQNIKRRGAIGSANQFNK